MLSQVTPEQITALYNFGKLQYSYGNYSGAADYLYHFLVLSTDAEANLSAQWGKLASDILTGRWDIALEDLNTLRDAIDSRSPASLVASASTAAQNLPEPALAQLNSRTWLVHWSLFVYFNHPQGRTLLLETFLSPSYLNTIQTSSPWILRYLTAAAILSRKAATSPVAGSAPLSSRVRNAIREVVKVIQTEEYQYQDPVTSFLKELYVEFDFEAAQQQLALAEIVVSNDWFLSDFKDEFLDNARYLISEAYCRIHQKIDIAYVTCILTIEHSNFCIRNLSERLNLSSEEGEKWIVNLIRETRMGADAKIDLGKVGGHFIVVTPSQSVFRTSLRLTVRRCLYTRPSSRGHASLPSGRKPLVWQSLVQACLHNPGIRLLPHDDRVLYFCPLFTFCINVICCIAWSLRNSPSFQSESTQCNGRVRLLSVTLDRMVIEACPRISYHHGATDVVV